MRQQTIPFVFILIAGLFIFSTSADDKTDVQFFKGSLAEAQQLAAEKGKVTVAFFHAKWCAPCKVMEEYTLKNVELAAYINDNFVPIQIDVDEFDGYDAKQSNNVKLLPTIIMFDTKQRAVARYEETMSAEDMLKVLRSNNRSEFREPQTNLASEVSNSKVPAYMPTAAQAPNKKHTTTVAATKVPASPAPATKPAKEALADHKISRISATKLPPKGAGLQAGAFVNADKATRLAYTLLPRVPADDKIVVVVSNNMGEIRYHVIVGGITTEAQARAQKDKYKALGIDTWLKKWGS